MINKDSIEDDTDNKKNPDIENEIDYLHYLHPLQKNTALNSSKKGLKIVKKINSALDGNDEKDSISNKYSNSNLVTFFINADKFDILIIRELLQDPYIRH